MPRKYKKPPIVEALCDVQFISDAPWDLTLLGLIYGRMRDTFPVRQPVGPTEITLRFSPAPPEEPRRALLMQFRREDSTALMQVGPNRLSINHLAPYPSWEGFLPLIHQSLQAYRDLAQPSGIYSLGLRYLNRIELSGSSVNLSRYFNFYPNLAPDLPQPVASFIIGIDVPAENDRDSLKVELTTAETDTPEKNALILDLDYRLNESGSVEMDDVFAWLDVAHTRVEAAFEACITDDLRKLFEEESN